MALTKVIGLGNLDDNITFSTASKGVHLGATTFQVLTKAVQELSTALDAALARIATLEG